MPATEVSANYYYSVKLRNTQTGAVYNFGGNSRSGDGAWSGWINVNKYDNHWWNGLRDWIENDRVVHQEGGDDDSHALPCRYTDGYGNNHWCDNADESSFKDKILYEVIGIAFKGKAEVGNHGQWYEVLDGDDYFYMQGDQEIEIFNRIKDEIKEMDLREWGKHFWEAEHYFGEMVALETLYLPNNDLAIYDQYMFANAYNLTNIVWSEHSYIREVGKGAFRNCFKLPQSQIQRIINEVAAHSAQGVIGEGAFFNCLQLVDVTIPARIRWIGNDAFSQEVYTPNDLPSNYDTSILKPSLKTVTLQTDASKTGSNSFQRIWYYEDPRNTSGEWYGWSDNDKWAEHYSSNPDGDLIGTWTGLQMDYIGNTAFADCQEMTTVNLGDGIQLKALGYGVFANCRFLTSSNIQAILDNYSNNWTGDYQYKIPAGLFWGVNGKKMDGSYVSNPAFTTVTIPENVMEIGAGAFGVYDQGSEPDHPSIKDIYVSRGWRPDCKVKTSSNGYTVNGFFENFTAFSGIVPNHCTVHFSGDAAKYSSSTSSLVGYTNYQTDNSEFQRLLTKDIYSDAAATTYDVEPQQHAIVRLHRTLKAGWNTVCLPFGATAAAKEVPVKVEGEPTANSTIFKNTLNGNGGSGFMLAVYRDYLPSNNNFRFLRVSDYDNFAIEPCVPFIVKMDASDLNSDNIYTFTNVDVNYKWNKAGETYNASITTPASTVAENFSGKTESFAPFNDGKGLNSDYVFSGTFKTMTGTVGNSDAINGFITTNDYYMQNNGGTAKYYQYESGKKVGIKAFTGWFHYTGSLSGAKMASIDMDLFDGFETTSIPDIEVLDASHFDSNVYNINGVLIGKRAAVEQTLPKGVYISDGKKFIVK